MGIPIAPPLSDVSSFLGTWTGQTTLSVLRLDKSTGLLQAVLGGGTAGVLQPQSTSSSTFASFVFRSLVVQGSLDSWSVENGCGLWMFNGLDGTQVIFERETSQQPFQVRVVGQTDWKARLVKQ